MSKYNNGHIFSNDKCIGCGRCMLHCPADDTNVSVYRNGKRFLEVNGDKCIDCSLCIPLCNHGAREYYDDTERFFRSLENGEKISLIISPALSPMLGNKLFRLLGFLRSKGVDKIYDASFGAEISVWRTAKYIKEYDGDPYERPFITGFCPTVVNYIEKYIPESQRYLIPVHSPMMCTAVYARKYMGEKNRMAYLSTCVSKKDETEAAGTGGMVDYSVTLDHLMKYIGDTDLSGFNSTLDLSSDGFGRAVSAIMGYYGFMTLCFPEESVIITDDRLDESMQAMIKGANDRSISNPEIVVITACEDGCGSGIGAGSLTPEQRGKYFDSLRALRLELLKKKQSCGSHERFYELLCESFSGLDPDDFLREFEDRYIQPDIVPENVINDIFVKMHMTTEESRMIDCHACGYRSCREMAVAVAKGYAHIDDCIRYVTGEFRKKLFFDDLTGLLSPQGFHIEGNMMMKAHPEKKYVICVGNINGIKTINDLYNFNIGSQVIVYVAHFLNSISNGIGICSRLGGNIFVLCIEDTPENLRRLMAIKYFDCGDMGINMPVTVRFGLCRVNELTDLSRIVNYASFAMEKNTDRSKNSFKWYDEKMKNEIMVESSITSHMRTAMYKNEFAMYLQPQYNHSNGKIVGAESLCRWLRSDGTVISPAVFIPIFEKNGFIKKLDRFMWEEAFKQVKKWLEDGTDPVPISVNISRMSLVDDDIINIIKKFKEQYEIDPKYIHFEITESAYTSSQDDLITRISKIRDLGFKIAMDDFGSGYSSLNTLKDIPIDILKLDMGFLRGDSNREKGGSIIGSVIRMAHSLGLLTVAEGVETSVQADFLKSMGCDIIQGFLYAKPMPVDKYNDLFEKKEHEHFQHTPTKQVDISGFFDLDSSESMIFDNYIGPAAMFEYSPGSVDMIKINDDMTGILGFGDISFADYGEKVTSGICTHDLLTVKKAIRRALSGERAVKFVFNYMRPDGKTIKILSRIWYLGNNGIKSIMYATAEDVTDIMK